ncbi:flagellar biosynthesis protein FlgA [Rhizobium sp. CFBP 8762]|uniref:SAF domain-containing protein n=1 Tax=Rhizobium sp. CFBP 8762 TaxID=2775279 RepID=UPI00177D850D|nr:flagellar biosynthesis protein FlgA [Rhizobium sp. CFBP 8762]
MIYHHLYKKFAKKDVVRVGVIGAGNYGTAIVTQDPHTPMMTVVAVADISVEAAKGAYEKAGIDPSTVVYCRTTKEAQQEIAGGKRIYTDRCELIAEIAAVDIVCEATGIPEASADYASKAIENGKHVAMITKDCDVTIGPILKKKADEAGVVYTPVDGDQHGLLIQFYEWAKSIGLTVLSGGKATDGEFIYDEAHGTVTIKTDKKIHAPYVETVTIAPEDSKYLGMIPKGQAAEYVARRREILAGLPQPGSYDLCETTVAANYTGLAPAVDTLVHAPLRITEIPIAYCETDNGGIFGTRGVIDLATCLRAPTEGGLGGGVFLVVRCDNAYSNHILTTKGQIANYDDTAAVIYRPYHLCGVETSSSILVAGLLGINTGSDDYQPRYDLVKVAAHDIKAGEVFGNDHSPQTTARIVPAIPIASGNAACAHLLTGNRASIDIPAGTTITYDMVEEPVGSTLWRLRRLQDETFLA